MQYVCRRHALVALSVTTVLWFGLLLGGCSKSTNSELAEKFTDDLKSNWIASGTSEDEAKRISDQAYDDTLDELEDATDATAASTPPSIPSPIATTPV